MSRAAGRAPAPGPRVGHDARVPIDPPPVQSLSGAGVRLRLATREDLPALTALVREPDVAPWWPTWGPPEEEFVDPEVATYVIEAGGETAGVLMFHEETAPAYRSAGMDIAVSGRFRGLGLGRRALALMARHLFEERAHHRLTIDPAAANARAIRAYHAVGFRDVGVMRRSERGPDGVWRDGLLMDMLAGELREP